MGTVWNRPSGVRQQGAGAEAAAVSRVADGRAGLGGRRGGAARRLSRPSGPASCPETGQDKLFKWDSIGRDRRELGLVQVPQAFPPTPVLTFGTVRSRVGSHRVPARNEGSQSAGFVPIRCPLKQGKA